MTPLTSIERAEYWILNLIVDTWYPIWALRGDEVGFHSNNYHGLSDSDLVSTLHGLFLRGDIIARQEDTEDGKELYTPSFQSIEAAVMKRGRIIFGLTAQGGNRWESLFKPDWDRYVTGWITLDEEPFEIEAASRARIVDYLSGVDFVEGLTTTKPSSWELLSPWHVTYWKTLPSGYRYTIFPSPTLRAEGLPVSPGDWCDTPEAIGRFDPALPVDWALLE